MGWSRNPLYTVRQKGHEAALAGLPRDTCPYWSPAFKCAWLEAYDQALRWLRRQAAHPTDRSESDEREDDARPGTAL